MKVIYIFFFIISFHSYAQKISVKEIDVQLEQSFQSFVKVELMKSLSEATKALEMSESTGYNAGIIRSRIYIAKILVEVEQYTKALDFIQDAEKQSGFGDNKTMVAESHRLKGMIYTYTRFYSLAKKEFRKQLETSLQIKDPNKKNKSLFYTYQCFANLYNIERKLDSARINLYHAQSLLSKMKEEERIFSSITIGGQLAGNFIQQKETDSAKLYLDNANALIEKNKVPYTFSIDILYGDLYSNLQDKNLAIKYYEKALANASALNMPNVQQEILTELAEMYKGDNNEKYTEHLLTLNKLKDNNLLSNAKVATQISNYLIDIEKDKTSLLIKKILWLTAGGGVLILLYLVYNFLKNKSFRKRLKYKRELLEEKEQQIKILKSQEELLAMENVIELAKEFSPEFMFAFKKLYPQFDKKLLEINPELKISEITFLAFIKLQFCSKEIADYTHTSTKTVQNRKNAIRKRLNIDSNEDLYLWINKIE